MGRMRFSALLLGSATIVAGCGPSAVFVDDTCDRTGDRCGSGSVTDGDDGDDGDDGSDTEDGAESESGGTTEGTRPPEPPGSDSGATSDTETTSSGDDGGSETGAGSSSDGDPVDDGLVELSECPELTTESVYCLTAVGGGLDLVGVDTGTQCPLGPGFEEGSPLTSLGWIGNDVYACSDPTGNADFSLAHVDLVSGILETSDVGCRAAAALDGQILTLPSSPSGPVLTYDSFDDATMGVSEEIDFSPQASRVTAADGTIYAAWHSTDVLERYSVAEQAPLPDLVMGGYDSWVQGMSVVGNRLFVVTWSGTLLELDATTGEQVSESEGWPGHGLACRPGTG